MFSLTVPILLQGKYVDRSWKYIKLSQTNEFGNWDWGRAIPRKMGFPSQCVCKASYLRLQGRIPCCPSATHFPIHLVVPVSPQAATRAQFTNPFLSCIKGEEDLMVWINRNLHLLFKYLLFLPCFAAVDTPCTTMHIDKLWFSTCIGLGRYPKANI